MTSIENTKAILSAGHEIPGLVKIPHNSSILFIFLKYN